jgi:hypothetical protein
MVVLPKNNRTKRYLYETLHIYQDYIRGFTKSNCERYEIEYVCIGIGDDSYLQKHGSVYDQHLFMLIKVTNGDKFADFLSWFRVMPFYEDDYEYGELDENYHIFVFKMHDDFKKAIQRFKESKYSEMYSLKQIVKLERLGLSKESIDVLTKNYESNIAKRLAEKLGVDPYKLPELDYKLNFKEEIFNYVDEK